MRAKFVRTGLQALAAFFIILGFLGLFLPFLQGILFIVIGITLLSVASPAFKMWLDRRLERYPRARSHFDHAHARVSKWFN